MTKMKMIVMEISLTKLSTITTMIIPVTPTLEQSTEQIEHLNHQD